LSVLLINFKFKKINASSLQPSQQPPLPHTATHAQSYLPAVVQQQPMVVHSKVARSQHKSSTLSASEVAFFRISDKLDTFASQLTSINTTKSNYRRAMEGAKESLPARQYYNEKTKTKNYNKF
jgi:hypothetical protein